MLLALILACGGDRFGSDAPLAVPRTPPWALLALPAGRDVASDGDGLTVRSEGTVDEVDAAWDAALRGLGFEVQADTSRGAMRVRTYARGPERWALSVTAREGQTTADLRVLP